jgi:PAS domain S-box-containing protein
MDDLFQMLDNAADGAFVIDEEQRIVYWNDVAQDLLGYTSDEVIGRTCYEILGGQDDRGRMICRDQCPIVIASLQRNAVTNYDTFARTKSGVARWLNVSILTFPISDNQADVAIVHLFRDAAHKKQNEQFIYRVIGAVESLQEIAASTIPALIAANPRAEELTDRDHEVLSLLAQGFSTHDIAQSLSISSSTTRNHVQNILHKLHVHSRLEAVAYAFEHGLVSKD